jgi:hypothetical protein
MVLHRASSFSEKRNAGWRCRQVLADVLYRDECVVAVSKNHHLAKPKVLYHFPTRWSRGWKAGCGSHSRLPRDEHAVPIDRQRRSVSLERLTEYPLIAIDIGEALISRRRPLSNHLHYLRITEKRIYCDVTLVYISREYIQRAVRELNRLCYTFYSSRPQA